jgi:hypothetical protein
MLPNEQFALACRAWYEEQGLIVDKTNGEFAHCPLPKKMGRQGHYLLPEHHIVQGLLQSEDCDRCCFFSADTLHFLLNTTWFPQNFFRLWDIYDKYKGWSSHQPERNEKLSQSVSQYISNLTEEGREKRNQNLSNGIKSAWDKKTKDEKRRHMRKAQEVALTHNEKPVKVSFPNGEDFYFESMEKAAISVGVSYMTIRNWAKLGKIPKSGKHKGVKATFV